MHATLPPPPAKTLKKGIFLALGQHKTVRNQKIHTQCEQSIDQTEYAL